MGIFFKALHAQDLPIVADIELRAHSHPWTLKNFEDALTAGYLALGVWQGASLLGYAWAMRALDEAEILDITIDPHFQRRGLGRQLLREAHTRLAQSGCVAVFLEVRASNGAARALYASEGFAEIGVRTGYYPAAHGREDAIMMKKNLKANDANA